MGNVPAGRPSSRLVQVAGMFYDRKLPASLSSSSTLVLPVCPVQAEQSFCVCDDDGLKTFSHQTQHGLKR